MKIIEDFSDISSIAWDTIQPDANNDWLNQRDPSYQGYTSLSTEANSVFNNNVIGVVTNRDSWVINFSKKSVENNVNTLIENYNSELGRLRSFNSSDRKRMLNRRENFVKWTRKLERMLSNDTAISYDESRLILTLYRPFTKKWFYYSKDLNEETRLYYKKFGENNLVITTTGRGVSRDFSTLITNLIPNMDSLEKSQGFMRFDNEVNETSLFQNNDNMNQAFADKLGLSLDETFAYVYGLLNSREYQEKYANDLKKDLARIPIVKNKEKYVEVGQKLMDLHLNYEEVPVYEGVEITPFINPSYKVTKMRFAKKRDEKGKSVNNLSTIIFNSDITISNIPEKAYEYVVNGRSAIEWIIDQYQVKTDRKSGIKDDPNDYSEDEKYIFNLLLRIINVSVQTVDLINSLPKFEVED